MTLTESIRYALSEGVLKWTTTDEDTGAQEAVMTDGSKFTLKSIGGELIVSYISKGGNKGNEIYHTPTNAPMAFTKAKQAAEKFIGAKKDTKHNTDDKENEHSENEELSHTRDIGTPTLTQQNKEVTPGQSTSKKESLEQACWKGYKAVGTKEKDGKTVPNCVPEAFERDEEMERSIAAKQKKYDTDPSAIGDPLDNDERNYLRRKGSADMLNGRKQVIDQILPSGRVLLKGKDGPMEVSANDLQPTGGSKLKEAFGKSGLDVNHLAQKMGFKKPIPRTTDGQISYRFKGITRRQLSAALENNGYTEFDEFSFGDDIITDHKKGDVIIRVGPADNGASAWFTITSDYSDYSAESDLYAEEATFDKEADIKHLQTLIDNPDEAFAKKNYGSIEAYKKMLQNKIDRLQKNEAVQGTEMVTLKSTDKLEVKYGSILVNGRPFEMTDPDESLDWPKSVTSDGKLVTWFKGDKESASEWEPSEISGYFSDVKKESHNESISFQKHIRMISLIAEESDHDLIEKFLMENSIKGQENQLSYIRTAFKRFKKVNS